MSNRATSYDELFSRNIGVFTPEQQERIRTLKVAIAGCGGLGAPVAHLLTRLGVGELRLADPESFEPSNLNRQWGAYLDTIGVNKAEATAVELRRIHPDLRIAVFPTGLAHSTVQTFIEGVDAVVDALEFFQLAIELQLHAAARGQGQWVFAAQGLLDLNSGFAIDPYGARSSDYISPLEDPDVTLRAVMTCFPVLPSSLTMREVQEAIASGRTSVPSWCVPPVLDAAMVVADIVAVLVRGESPMATFPKVRLQNTKDFSISIVEPPSSLLE